MITIEKVNKNSETKERTKEQLKDKVKPEKLYEDDREEILEHIHDTVDFGCTETIYPNTDRNAMLNKVREVLQSGVQSNDVKVSIVIDDKTEKNLYYVNTTNLNGLLGILGL